MANPTRPMTHKKQRKLSDTQVRYLLTEYDETDITYRALAKKYGISWGTVGGLICGLTYRDVPDIADLLARAQQKAAARSKRYSSAKAVRVPDPRKTVVEVDSNSIGSVNKAILLLLDMRSCLVDAAVEVSND